MTPTVTEKIDQLEQLSAEAAKHPFLPAAARQALTLSVDVLRGMAEAVRELQAARVGITHAGDGTEV